MLPSSISGLGRCTSGGGEGAGVVEHTFCCGGFACVDVGDYAYVSDEGEAVDSSGGEYVIAYFSQS